jgi:trigger factor
MAKTATATPEIQITVAHSDSASRVFAITVPVERWKAAEAETVRYYSKRAKVPGFRQGKVPEPVVRKRFGEAIRQSAIEELLREAWDQARKDLHPISDPQVRNLKVEEGSPLTFEIAVDVRPELELARLEGFTVERRVPPVTDDMVDAQLHEMREQKAPWLPAEGRAKPGDLVQATIVNLDEPDAEAGEPVRFVLGQGRALPDLEAHVMELDPGQTWEGSIRFPDDHPDEAKRGTSRSLRVTLHEVKRMELPELTDEFAKELGDFADVAALKAAVRADLEAEARRHAESEVRARLMDQIAAANNIAVPPSLLHRALHAYARSYGIPEEKHHDFEAEFQPIAEAGVRRELIIDAVASKLELHATAADLDAKLAEIGARRGESAGAVRAALEKAGRLRELERGITEDKVFAHLLAKNTVEETTAPVAR